jgi:hypothetical protein
VFSVGLQGRQVPARRADGQGALTLRSTATATFAGCATGSRCPQDTFATHPMSLDDGFTACRMFKENEDGRVCAFFQS